MTHAPTSVRLRKELGLLDVYAISTGAMFSSGFFLLPGLAAAQTGPSVPLAYVVAGLFILPALFSVAELATAMPRAGGAYYFLDRSLGPLVGTVGGLGTWFALVLKSAFALVGMGAYLGIYFDVPIRPVAIGLTLVFLGVNLVGAKESGGLQRILVAVLLSILVGFLAVGFWTITSSETPPTTTERFTPLLPFGLGGFMSTVGFVFVSYAGLTKVASVSEEVLDPDRNIPLGMMLSLATATIVYGAGVFVMVAVLPPEVLREDLTPVATAAAHFSGGAADAVVALIVVAAIAAFASTGNAGVLSASRYPLAMGRDGLVSPRLADLGRHRTPSLAIGATGALMIVAIVALPIEAIAKLASAFQLLLFSLLSLAVVIMRESRIQGYDPGYRTPLYPWLQIVGILSPIWLITQMGQMAVLISLALVAGTAAWYFHYAVSRVDRSGAIFHAFARLGELRRPGLDVELRHIAKEKGLRDGDHFHEVVASAGVMDFDEEIPLPRLLRLAADHLETSTGVTAAKLREELRMGIETGLAPVSHGVAIPHLRVPGVDRPTLLLVRCRGGIRTSKGPRSAEWPLRRVRAVFFLVSPENGHGVHLRLLGHLATCAEEEGFLSRWTSAGRGSELRTTLLADEHLVTLIVAPGLATERWIGESLSRIALPEETLVALIRREGRAVVPRGATVVAAGDLVTVIGKPDAIHRLEEDLHAPRGPTTEVDAHALA